MRIVAVALVSFLGFAGVSFAQEVVPIASAGPDVAIECVGQNGTPIAMKGTGSSAGADFTYLWTADPAVSFDDPTLLGPIAAFPVGTTLVTLTVTYTDPATEAQWSASDSLYVVVSDPNAPHICACADPAVLWPPNHKMHDVQVRIRVYDTCDANPDVELLSVTSNEDDDGLGDGHTSDDVEGAVIGSDDRDFAVRAERSGPGEGRTYTAVYRAWDLGENHSDASVVVGVPHDMGQGSDLEVDECPELDDYIASQAKVVKKAEKAQLKAAKQSAKATKKALKAAQRAAR